MKNADTRVDGSPITETTGSTASTDSKGSPQFTPGPWTICLGSGNNFMTGVAHFSPEGTTFVADCLPDYALRHGTQPKDHRPNMRLIAAAPDLYAAGIKMLDALYGPLECTHGNEGDEDICDGCAYQREKATGRIASELRAALAKAEGK